jgi:hypothetical protein
MPGWWQPYSTPPSGPGGAISTEGGKEVPSMSKDHKQEPETVDITALADEELDDVVGGAGANVPLTTKD